MKSGSVAVLLAALPFCFDVVHIWPHVRVECRSLQRCKGRFNQMAVQTRKQRARVADKELVQEEINGEVIEYYPLGEYVVIQPQVCGGRPTIKNTRLPAGAVIAALGWGETRAQVADGYRIPAAAVDEAVALAEQFDYEKSYG